MIGELLEKYPIICELINKDLDAHAIKYKIRRHTDALWEQEHSSPMLEGLDLSKVKVDLDVIADPANLKVGRSRMKPEVAFIFMGLRGQYGGFEDQKVWNYLSDSCTLAEVLSEYGVTSFPSSSAARTNVNAISGGTRLYILQCQMQHALGLELDDLKELYIDSTHVHANSAWPTDSSMILKLLECCYKMGQKMSVFGLPNFRIFRTEKWVKELHALEFAINLAKTKKVRRKQYRKFLDKALKLLDRLDVEYERLDIQASEIDIKPSLKAALKHILDVINCHLINTCSLIYYTYERISVEEAPEREEHEEIFSISDTDAAFIKKGGRATVFGYRPQLTRSANGFVTSAIVPVGNVGDSTMLLPVVLDHIRNTGLTPLAVSTDDGYSKHKIRR